MGKDTIPERITLSVPKDLMARAKATAALQGTSVSAAVRVFLKAWIGGRLDPQDLEQPEE